MLAERVARIRMSCQAFMHKALIAIVEFEFGEGVRCDFDFKDNHLRQVRMLALSAERNSD